MWYWGSTRVSREQVGSSDASRFCLRLKKGKGRGGWVWVWMWGEWALRKQCWLDGFAELRIKGLWFRIKGFWIQMTQEDPGG